MNGFERIRRSAIVLALSAALVVPAFPAPATASVRPPSVTVPSVSLMTMSGSLGWSKNKTSSRRVASTIKMLNALVVRENTSLDEVVTVTRAAEAISDGDVGLVKGQRIPVRRLLDMMLIASANDAAEALAIHIGGTEKAYVAMMNAKATALGLKKTHAVDPHGLSERERSTATGLSVLAREVMADPVLRSIVKKHYVTVPLPHGKTRTLKSTNRLLLDGYSGIEGVKTGYTSSAGYCFVGAAKRNGVELLGVVLGARSLSSRFSEMKKLLDWGFKNCHLQTLVSGDEARVVPVNGCPLPGVSAHPETTVTIAVFDGGRMETTVTLDPSVSAPVSRGQRLGTVRVSRDGVVLASVPLLADADVTTEALQATNLRQLATRY